MKRKSVIAIVVAFFLSFCVGTGKSAWLIAVLQAKNIQMHN